MTTSSLYPACRNRRDAQLDFLALRQLEFDLAVLRFTPFCDVEAGHDLQSRDDGAPIALRNLHVLETVAVDTETDQGFTFFSIGLDVNIRRVLSIGICDDLIGESDDGVVVFIQSSACGGILRRLGLCLGDQFAENVGDIFVELSRPPLSPCPVAELEELGDIATETDGKANVEAGERPLDILRRDRGRRDRPSESRWRFDLA